MELFFINLGRLFPVFHSKNKYVITQNAQMDLTSILKALAVKFASLLLCIKIILLQIMASPNQIKSLFENNGTE